jgi:hypothetical protein
MHPERSKGLERFQFEEFKETRDRLFFYNLDDIESMAGKHVDSLKFKKLMLRLSRVRIMK